MKKILMTAAAVALIAGAAGCAVRGASTAPQLTFSNYAPISLNVASTGVTEAYTNPNDPQDVSSQFVLAPAEAVKRYAANRYQSSGANGGYFTIEIQDSRVHLNELKQKSKVLAAMDAGTEDEYHVWLVLKVTSAPAGFQGTQSTTIKMDRTLVMRSSVTLAEREMEQIKFLEKLIADVDAKINEAMASTPAIRN